MTLRCEVCGRFISYIDVSNGKARHVLVGYAEGEEWETTCRDHTTEPAPPEATGGDDASIDF